MSMADEWAIRRLLERYCRFMDDGNIPAVLELFDPDCTVDMLGGITQGKAAFEATLATSVPTSQPAMMHILSNPVIEVDGAAATSTSNWTLVDHGGDGGSARVVLAGLYRDTLTHEASGWRISSRAVSMLGQPA